jgi:hypothetical protein
MGLPIELDAQRYDSPQARILYRDEDGEYTIQALNLYRGHLIVLNKQGGMMKTVIEVSAMNELDLEQVYEDQSVFREESVARGERRGDVAAMNQGLMIAGTEQRIIGIVFDPQYMYVLVAGYAPDYLQGNVAEVIRDEDEVDGNAEERGDSTAAKRPVRVMLHAYQHQTSARHFSHEVLISSDLELGTPDLGEGPLEKTENGVACFGWEFEFMEVDFVTALGPDGAEQQLPTVIANDRMRSL